MLRRRQLNFLLYGQSGELFRVGRSAKIIIIVLSFSVGTSKNKNIDHRVKGTSAIMLTQVTYETDPILLFCDLTMSSAPIFCFLFILL